MTRFIICMKMPMFILSQCIFKQPASIYQSWQSSVDLSGVGQGLYDKSSDKLCAPAQLLLYEQKYKRKDKKHMRTNDKTVTGCMHPLSSHHIAHMNRSTKGKTRNT